MKSKKVLNVFLSYTHKDGSQYLDDCISLIKKCCKKSSTPIECYTYYDNNMLQPGDDFWSIAEKYYQKSDIAILIITPQARMSSGIGREIEYFKSLNKKIIPIIFEGDFSCLPDSISNIQSLVYENGLTEKDEKSLIEVFENSGIPYVNLKDSKTSNKKQADNKYFKTIIISAVEKGISSAIEKIVAALIIVILICILSFILGKEIDWQSIIDSLYNFVG